MTMRVRAHSALLALLAAVACREPLLVENLNNPETERVFRQPASIEAAIGSSYQVCRNHHNEDNLYEQLMTMSGESYSQLNNFSMGPRGSIPRTPVLNNKSASQAEGGRYGALQRATRFTANAVQALDNLRATDLDGLALDSDEQDQRARAMGFFGVACTLGIVGLAWDSAGSLADLHTIPVDSVPGLKGGHEVVADAISYLDSAIAIATSASTNGGFPTEPEWFGGNSLDADDFARLARSWRARFRAQVARTPTERAAVDWAKVIADAENGITSDLVVEIGGATGWDIEFNHSQMHVSSAWHQLHAMYWGMADVAGGYATEIAKDASARGYFLIVTPDLRWPQGATRAAQRAASPEGADHTDLPYIKNRSGADTPGDPWGATFYNHHRYKYIRNNANAGPYPDFLTAEVDLLAAEGYIRTGQFAQAAAKIDIWRTRAGLPALTGVVTDGDDPVPGGANCVPKVPVAPARNLVCGNIMEAMKWEWRMEMAFNVLGAWFFPSRGWGDLIEGTVLQYPVPVGELDARLLPYYNLGGGGLSSAGPSSYGFP
jgi:hypothetical protein